MMQANGKLLSEYILLILLPISPILALVIDELLDNKNAVVVADNSVKEAESVLYSRSVNIELEQLMYNWSHYRSEASPIFAWLYWLTQKTMNNNMIIDANALVEEFNENSAS